MFSITALLVLPSCMASVPSGGASLDRDTREAREVARDLEEVDRALDERLASDRCDEACALPPRICSLAERLCAIAARHPDDAPLGERCRDGEARCESAGERVAARCACETAL